MKKRIEDYIPRAIELIKEVEIAKDGEVNNKFNGYFSSFGASIVQSGLKPTLAFFSNEESKEMIVKAIAELLKKHGEAIGDLKLLDYVIASSNEENLKSKIIDASIALKLAVRTYKLKKDE